MLTKRQIQILRKMIDGYKLKSEPYFTDVWLSKRIDNRFDIQTIQYRTLNSLLSKKLITHAYMHDNGNLEYDINSKLLNIWNYFTERKEEFVSDMNKEEIKYSKILVKMGLLEIKEMENEKYFKLVEQC